MKNNLLTFAMLASLVFGLTLTACGTSKRTQAIIAAPTIDDVEAEHPALKFLNKLIWLQHNAESGGSYVINIGRDYEINDMDIRGGFFEGLASGVTGQGNLSYKDKENITITIRGIGGNHTIVNKSNTYGRPIFDVGSGVTLILENITLKGSGLKLLRGTIHLISQNELVRVSSGGTLVINDGVTITNNFNNEGNAAGIYVDGGGTFIMKGGNISGNICSPVVALSKCESSNAYAAQSAGTNMRLNKCEFSCKGGGVYVSGSFAGFGPLKAHPSATFIKTGGTIAGYNVGSIENSNMIKNPNGVIDPVTDGVISQNNGHAIYFDIPGGKGKAFDTDVGPEITLEFKDDVLKEGRAEGASAPVAPTVEPIAEEAAGEQPAVPQAVHTTPQEEYDAEMLRIKAKAQELIKEYQESIQKNPAGHKEATEKYQKDFQEVQQEALEAKKKYQEAMQKQ